MNVQDFFDHVRKLEDEKRQQRTDIDELKTQIDMLKKENRDLRERRMTKRDNYRCQYAHLLPIHHTASTPELQTMLSLTGKAVVDRHIHTLCGFQKDAERTTHPACGNRFGIDWVVLYEVAAE